MARRTNAALIQEMEKCCDIVWYARCASRIIADPVEVAKTPKDILTGLTNNMTRVESLYDPDELMEASNSYQVLGRWEGKLAALRWSLGDDENNMDT